MMTKPILQVLIIEDNPGDVRLISEYLKEDSSTQYEVVSAGLLSAGIDYLKQSKPDIILLDLSLPDSQGFDTLARLIDHAPLMPVIILTAFSDDDFALQAIKAGAQDFLVKGQISSGLLIRAIRYSIQRKQLKTIIQQNEERYRHLFEESPVALLLEDYSAVKRRLDELQEQGVADLNAYLEANPHEVSNFASLIKVVDVNQATLALYKAKDKAEFIRRNLSLILSPAILPKFKEDLVRINNGEEQFDLDEETTTLTGEKIYIHYSWKVTPGYKGDLSRVLVSIEDITQRRKAEEKLKKINQQQLRMVQLGQALASTLDLNELYRKAEEHLQGMIDCPAFGISLFDPEKRIITSVYASCDGKALDVSAFPPLLYDPEHAEHGRSNAVKTKTCTIIRDLKAQMKVSGGILMGGGQEPQSAIYVPMLIENQVIGLLELQSYQPDAYNEEDCGWLSNVAHQIGLSIQNARLFSETQRRMQRMQSMAFIDQAINSSLDLNIAIEIVVDQAMQQLQASAVDILLVSPATNMLTFARAKGFYTDEIKKTAFLLGSGLPGRSVFDRTTVAITDLKLAEESHFKDLLMMQEGFVSYYCVPLITKGELKGVMEVYFRQVFEADAEWLEFLEMLAQQAAIVINNAELLDNLQVKNVELLNAYETTLKGWVDALDMRDKETEGHTERVTELSLQLARRMGMEGKELIHFQRGALLHDIGKVAISDSILKKAGPLSEEEWKIMHRHPAIAFELLSKSNYLIPALDIPYCHHEKWDGSGYPRGLKGEQIPLSARIFAIVDVWDALTSDRPYRKAWPHAKALKYIQEQSGIHFDPEVVQAFLELVHEGD